MPQVDLTITISVIVALCAIISPVATTIINNRYQLKLKKLDLEQKSFESTILYKRSIFENYLKYAGRCIAYSDDTALKDYGEYYLLSLMYAPPEIHPDMIKVHELMSGYHWKEATPLFEKMLPKMHTMLQNL